jgi:glycosyltransferase involved in cell wall biosynthesis
MKPDFSLCFPVFNEERTIASCLESALDQTVRVPYDILVCANGCSDATGDIVSHYAQRYPRVKLITTSQKGKPNAWNMLTAAAQTNYLFFGDGDVHFHRDSFNLLYEHLKSGDKIAYGARVIPVWKNKCWLDRLVDLGSVKSPQNCLVGRLYALDRSRVLDKLFQKGYSSMPQNVCMKILGLV